MGLKLLDERATALLESHAPAPPPQAPHDQSRYPDGLTAREAEILALLANGVSNVELARTLSLSVGTVRWHTVRIYQKIGVTNRAGAAAYAVRHGLSVSAPSPDQRDD
jgi:DNA-binding NarL/FixJ family response regulator